MVARKLGHIRQQHVECAVAVFVAGVLHIPVRFNFRAVSIGKTKAVIFVQLKNGSKIKADPKQTVRLLG